MPNITGMKSRYKLLFVVICICLAVALLCGILFALFSDRPNEQNEAGGAGTVVVELIEKAPFDIATTSQFVDHKTFHGISTGTLDTYMRAYLKPVVEAYDETLGAWILIPVSGKGIKLKITENPPDGHEPEDGKWVGADADGKAIANLSDAKFFYYSKILEPGDETTDLNVQIVDINMPEQFLNMEIRYNLHVFIEGAQVKNSLWKKIFNIDNLPAGVEIGLPDDKP